ncbi:disulfide bond formation protein B [Legionella oakridgensis]|uniref:Disulfide bond formation protein DsbB n=2 Tax=Legionella oakridgensis TaxID=29423 RepID=W0BDL8_9GAMM|nr:disulfide bond formation protein B [Legionella oakridgensis]AHE67960.1 disulfide bond formation protein DsbB [Legionella oakridgensis ATCC 33761 = DSM 21215]ETO92591.1 disulfide bond formation protein DsbB [Legionella oakridgensis RV-2-2007]KTD38776.1 transmembrane protein [Legionella oakridgensis]STY20960.1 inner (transmembrane) protein [Legionella longbeachae]
MMTQHKLHLVGNRIGLIIVSFILIFAFADQLFRHDIPCPLCLLQRIAFVGIGLCCCMNLKCGIKPSHYGLMLLSAVLGFAISLRQLFLHMAPGDPGYGPLLFNLHLYTWSAVGFFIILGLIAIAMLLEHGFSDTLIPLGKPTLLLMGGFLILILANGISTFIECGVLICPDNPEHYNLLMSSPDSKN